MQKKQELLEMLAKLDEKIQALEAELDQLGEQRWDIDAEITSIEKQENTQSLLECIFKISPENAMRVQLDSGTKTTPIMEEFCHSQKDYLVFEQLFWMRTDRSWNRVSLVVAKCRGRLNMRGSNLTMTDLKKMAGCSITEDALRWVKEAERAYPLYQELSGIAKKLRDGTVSNVMPFELPCLLKGQTFSNQTGYGSRYCGEELTHEGTLYGETTSFLMIGVLFE